MDGKNIVSAETAAVPNRRNFVRKLGLAAAGTAVAAATGEMALAAPIEPDDQSDVDVLNYLLNLEYLLAEFYTVAATGSNITQRYHVYTTGYGTPGLTTGGRQIPDFHTPSRLGKLSDIALELSLNESFHIYFLQFIIHEWYEIEYNNIAKPAINLNGLGFGFGSYQEFLILGRMLEDIVLSAYNYAAPYINSYATFQALASIEAIEGEHAGNLRTQIAGLSLPTKPLDCFDMIPPTGPGGRSFSGLPTAASGQYFSTDLTTGLTTIRDPGQILYLLYGNTPNVLGGGFFPNGVNGPLAFYSGDGSECSNPGPKVRSQFWTKKTSRARPALARPKTMRPTWTSPQIGVKPFYPAVRRVGAFC